MGLVFLFPKGHAGMPALSPDLRSGALRVDRRGGTAPPLAHDAVIPAGGDGVLVSGTGFVEEFTTQRDIVDPHWGGGFVRGEEKGGDIFLERHHVCVEVGVGCLMEVC